MKNFYIAIRSLSKKGRHSGIKILSLGVGLAMGLVLIAKVCFELSYDGFYPASDRIYAIQENVSFKDNPLDTYPHVSGGIAPGMKAEIQRNYDQIKIDVIDIVRRETARIAADPNLRHLLDMKPR